MNGGLESELRGLGTAIAFPATPDVAAAVRARLGERERRISGPSRRALALAFGLVAVAVAVAFAVPPARSAILRFFRIGGVEVERVDRLPAVRRTTPLHPGRRVTLAEARRLADFPIRLPTVGGYDAPDAVYFRGDVPGGVVFFVYGPARAPHALLSEFESTRVEARKIVGPGTPVEKVDVNGEAGYWFSGRPHIFVFFNRQGTFQFGTFRLATNTLVWRRGTLTYRLEAKVSQDHAVRIAESIP